MRVRNQFTADYVYNTKKSIIEDPGYKSRLEAALRATGQSIEEEEVLGFLWGDEEQAG